MIIDKIIQECIQKFVLNESISKVVYHFTNFDNAVNIIRNDKIILSTSWGGDLVDISNKKFYLSVTRQRNSDIGYPKAIGLKVRITLDGEKLNQRFSGKAVDFFGSREGLKGKFGYYKKTPINKYQPSTESEDRIFSHTPTIEHVSKYIIRMDVLDYNHDRRVAWLIHNAPNIYVYNN